MKHKLAITLSIFAFLISFGVGYIYYHLELNNTEESVEEYSLLASQLLWSYNTEAAESFVAGVLSNKEYLHIKILDIDQNIFIEGLQTRHKYLFPFLSNKILFKKNIVYKQEFVGTLEFTIHDHKHPAQLICLIIFMNLLVIIYFIVAFVDSKRKNHDLESQIIHSERLAAIGTMGAGLAHEINNPLTVVVGHTYLLQETIAKKYSDDPILLNMINKVISSVERIKKIVEHMKDFSRSGKSDAKSALTFRQVIDDTLIFVMPILQKNHIQLTQYIPETLPLILVNRIEIESVFQNLFINAKDALLTKINDRRIDIFATHLKATSLLEIKFADNGLGMSVEVINKIFNPFFTTKEIGKGTGLGLAIVKKIIAKHNGSISVSSEIGKGTTFTILLPAGANE